MRLHAVHALGKIGRRAVEPLISALGDPDPGVVRRAADALGRIGNRRALPALECLVQEAERGTALAHTARQAYESIRQRKR